ncbi:UDP-sugar pyrophosphorylase [Dendrobium catenatum]|uniref:UDP-sugar pyrophosphorylase n=1 Tax=Dendrobium catenatum TaxID=906689 RepID=A0A2I0VJA0_9ASPA|nr:UDP-sugar pyrophosphorylase [Dendrobium catenatum]
MDMLTGSYNVNRMEVVVAVKEVEEDMGQCGNMEDVTVNTGLNNDIIVDDLCYGSLAAQVEELHIIDLAKMLLHEGQSHLFANWAEQGVDDEKKTCFFNQVSRLNANYPGGLSAYIQKARQLLADSKTGKNPFEGFTPSVRKFITFLSLY